MYMKIIIIIIKTIAIKVYSHKHLKIQQPCFGFPFKTSGMSHSPITQKLRRIIVDRVETTFVSFILTVEGLYNQHKDSQKERLSDSKLS